MLFGERLMTPRLILRRPTMEDVERFLAWSHSQMAHGEYLTPERVDPEAAQDVLCGAASWQPGRRLFVVEEKAGGAAIGTLRYWLRPERPGCVVMAIKIAEPGRRGLGYGTEAQKYVIMHLFTKEKVAAVEMYTDINNRPQQRCLAKLGFTLVESLAYDDHQVQRVGHLFRLEGPAFASHPIYRYHYE